MTSYILPFIPDAESFLLGLAVGALAASLFWLCVKLARAWL
jgi:uncharacterized membrane protein YciS (DUF1049 family)